MCLGMAAGIRPCDGDRYILHYYGKDYDYILKNTPGGFVLVNDSDVPLGYPLGAVPFNDKGKYNFERVC